MKKKLIRYSVLSAVLLAALLFFVTSMAHKPVNKMQVLSYLKPFCFITQDKKPFTEKNMRGRVCVVNYFFTTCRSICPRMNKNLSTIYDTFKNDPGFMVVSHTCDPETDSAPVLKHYADSLKRDTGKWVFLTGRKDLLYRQARESYLLDDPKNGLVNITDQFLHTSFFALVDKDGNVRGQIYDGLNEADVEKLKFDIKALLKEEASTTGNF